MKKAKRKRKGIRVLLIVLACIAAVAAAVAIWQADNIKAVINSFRYTEEELSEMIDKNQEELQKEIKEKYNVDEVLSKEDEEKIISGEITVEEAVEKIKQETAEKAEPEKKTENIGGTSPVQSGTSAEAEAKTEKAVSDKVIEFYSLKAYYLGQLGQLEAKVKADYSALPKEKQNLVGKQEIAAKYMSAASALLNQCDAKMSELTSALEKEIKAAGGDTSVVSTIKKMYENEKNLKKSYYISKMK